MLVGERSEIFPRGIVFLYEKKSYVREYPGSLDFILVCLPYAGNAERGFDDQDVDQRRSDLFVHVRGFRELPNGRSDA